MGSSGAYLPLQYHMNDRLFFFVKKGKINVKMTPWRSRRYLNPIKDYENYEFFSNTNPWTSINKELRWLNFEVVEGYVLSVPSWWWYSIRFSSVDTEVVGLRYISCGNIVAHIPNWIRYYIQFHMTERVTIKKMDINSDSGTESVTKSVTEIVSLPNNEKPMAVTETI
jgi:hypothetical protein